MEAKNLLKLEEMLNTLVFYRGSIINEWIHLEKSIEGYILGHFTADEGLQKEMFELLVDRLTFHYKKEVLKAILDRKEDQAGFVKTNTVGYPHNGLIEELRKINVERNYFAHYVIDSSQEAIEAYPSEIRLMEFRDKAKLIIYTEKRYNELRDRIINAYTVITKLRE